MVINNNEQEFTGKTLQEYLNWKYPTKEDKEQVKEIYIKEINEKEKGDRYTQWLEGGELDLSEYVNVKAIDVWGSYSQSKITKLTLGDKPKLTKLICSYNQIPTLDLPNCPNLVWLICHSNLLTTLDISKCPNLIELNCSNNLLTSIDFLKQLPHPEKLTWLLLANNNIKKTDLEFLRPFINLTHKLVLGTDQQERYNNNIYNRFYGSLEPLRNMTKLPGLCIDGTDVEEGLEYLSDTVSKSDFNCSSKLPNQKVAKIQDQMRPFNYDLQAWQLAHPEKMLITQPGLFTNPDSKEKWLTALNNKVLEVRKEIVDAKANEADKLSKIARLEATISELTQTQSTISQQTQTEFSTQTKAQVSDLVGSEVGLGEFANQQLKKLLTVTEQELTNTQKQLEQTNQDNQEQIKQLTSKIKLLEQQKENYQNKYDKSIEFIKEIRVDVRKM